MDPNKRVTRSTSNPQRNPDETEGAFWGRVIDPTAIERGQVEAILMARRATLGDPTALLNAEPVQREDPEQSTNPVETGEAPTSFILDEEIPFTSNLTKYTAHSLQPAQAMQTTFVQNTPSTPRRVEMEAEVETVTTPVGMDMSLLDGPLDPALTRPTQQQTTSKAGAAAGEELDTQPMKGPREGNTTLDILDHFIDDNYGDVLRNSEVNLNSYMTLPSVKTSPPTEPRIMALDWYVPDGTNRRVAEVPDKQEVDFRSPGGGTGAFVLTLTGLMLNYNTTKFLIDTDTGELFGWIENQRRRTGLYCSTQPFVLKDLITLTARCGAALQMDLEQEQQTRVIQLSRSQGRSSVSLPPLPLLPDPDAYVEQPDVMTPNMRRNYIRDQTQAALTYIAEYEAAHHFQNDPQCNKQQVQQRLQIIYGKVDRVKEKVDAALHVDDIYRRRRVMCTLGIPQRFPSPQHMKNCTIQVWRTWICEENSELLAAIDEEIAMRTDPDDPFDGTASGIFAPLRREEQVQTKVVAEPGLDESRNRDISNLQSGRLVDVPTPEAKDNPNARGSTNREIEACPPQQPQPPRSTEVRTNREVGLKQQNIQVQSATSRRIEVSTQYPPQVTIQTNNVHLDQHPEDPFRSLRILHEQQRAEKQQSDPPHQSTSSQSSWEGAVGGIGANYPKPQRQNRKQNQNKKSTTQQQEIRQIQRDHSMLRQESHP